MTYVPVGAALLEPQSLEDALAMLAAEPDCTPIAGCTDIYVALHFGTLHASRFLDLWPLDELRGITRRNDTIVIGALTTCTAIIASEPVSRHAPALVAAAREIGGVQIQNRGTIGGNIANASPAGDTLPVLAALDAVVILRSAAGERRVPITGYYTGYRTSVRRPEELITAVEIPVADGTQWFRKVGTRAAQAISKVVFAGVRADPPRIALGSVAPTVVRAPRTEAALGAGATVEEAVRILDEEISPIDDIRSNSAYRRRVAGNLLRRFWEETTP